MVIPLGLTAGWLRFANIIYVQRNKMSIAFFAYLIFTQIFQKFTNCQNDIIVLLQCRETS